MAGIEGAEARSSERRSARQFQRQANAERGMAQQQAMMGNYAGAAAMNAQANNAQMNAVNQATMSVNGGVGMVPMGMAGQQLYAGAIGASPPVKCRRTL